MRRSKIKLSLIVIIISLILLSCKSSFSHTDITNQNIPSSSSFPEIVFNYNSTYTKQTFTVELQLEVDSFNILTMFFLTSGYKTNSEGIKVTFIIEQKEIIFTIERLFQDNLNHNLTQLFSFPEAFAGKRNITVICEAQTSYFYQSGTLHITSQTTIEKILPQTLTETPSSLPIFPDWIRFRGSTVSTIRKSITTVFNNSHDFDKLNFTLSFLASAFSAYKQYFEIEINNQIVSKRNFEENQLISETFLFNINSGLNLINIYFSVEMCIDEIQFSDIQLTTNGINNQDIFPENVFDWNEWDNNEFDHSFDLSALKPQVSYLEQIVEINIDYGCIGSLVLPSISYNINDRTEIVDSGDITESHQINAPQTITTRFTSTDSNQLFTFRIHGSAEGLGYFYILNTSFITIEVLPEFQENDSLERGMQETINYITPPSEPLVLTFKDFFRSTLNYQKSNISLSFSLINEFGSSIRQIHVLMKFDFRIIFDKQISFEKLIELQEQQALYSQVYEVTIILTLYGDGNEITLNNLKYSLFSSSNSSDNPISFPENPTSEPITPSKSIMLIEYGIILLFVTVLLTQHFQRKRVVDITTETFTQTEVGIMGVISKLLTFPRKWWLKAKESIFRLYLLPSSICYIVWKTNTLYKIIAELNNIANNSILHPQLTTFGKWGFYLFFLCSSASNLVLLSALYLTFVSTFYVDLFRFSKVLGVYTLFIYIPSSILVLLYIVSNSFKIKTFGIIILFALFLNIVVTSIFFGRTKNKQTATVKSSFFKVNVSSITNENEDSDLLISVEENTLSDEQYHDYKRGIISYIIDKITPEIQVSVNRFSEQFHIVIELAHKLLIDVSNDYSGLGKYYIEEQIYKRSPDNEIGSTNLDIRSQKKHGELIQYVNNNVKTANNGFGALNYKLLKNIPDFKEKDLEFIKLKIKKSWEEIKDLDSLKYILIRRNSNNNELVQAQLQVIDQIKYLMFPDTNWNNIFTSGTRASRKWKSIVSEIERSVLMGDRNPARIVLEQNLLDINNGILNEYRRIFNSKNTKLDTYNFFKKNRSVLEHYYIIKFGLTTKEAEVYLKYMAKMSGLDKNVIYINAQNMDEYWIRAWLKINKNNDFFHKKCYIASEDNSKNVVINSFSESKTPNSYGIDLYHIIKQESIYDVNFGELKVQSGAYDLIQDVSQYESLKDFKDYLIQTMSFYYGKHFLLGLELGGDIETELGHKITKVLAERRLTLADSMGQHLLHKLENTPEFYKNLVLQLGRKEADIVYDSIKKQAKLYSLIQHGAFNSFDESEIKTSLILRKKHKNNKENIEIPGDVFKLKISYDTRGGFLDIEGFSEEILKKIEISEEKKSLKWRMYKQLEREIRNSLDQVEHRYIDDLLSIFQHENVFLLKYTDMTKRIYDVLLKQFEDFKIFKDRKTRATVILGNTSPSKYDNWFSIKEQLFTVTPCDEIYSWYFPYKNYFEQRVDSDSVSYITDSISRLFIKMLGENSLVEILTIQDKKLMLDKLKENVNNVSNKKQDVSIAASILCLRKALPPDGVSTRLFSGCGTKKLDYKALVFLNSSLKPIKWDLGVSINPRDPYVNFMFKPSDILYQYPHVNKSILGYFPIDYKIEKGNFKMFFLRSVGNSKNVNAKIAKQEYVKEMNKVFSSDTKMLAFVDKMNNTDSASLSTADDILCALKLGIFCLLEYNRQWKMFSDAIIDFLNSYNGKYHELPSAGYGSLRIKKWKPQINKISVLKNRTIKIEYEAQHLDGTIKRFNEIVTIGLANLKAPSKGVKNWRIKPEKEAIKHFSNYNPYLKNIVQELKEETKKIKFPTNVSSEIVSGWNNFLDWVTRVS